MINRGANWRHSNIINIKHVVMPPIIYLSEKKDESEKKDKNGPSTGGAMG
jgi:hypothetical protein